MTQPRFARRPPRRKAIFAAACGAIIMHAAPGFCADRPIDLPPAARALLDQQQVPGAAWVLIDHGVTYSGAFGVTGPGGGRPTADTYFHLASISKPMTASALMLLVERGRLGLDDTLARRLPQATSNDPRFQRLTLRDLMGHRSGLRHYGHRFDDPDMSAEALDRIARQPLEFNADPGATFDYQNRNFQLLGAVIEAVTGERFETFVEREVLGGASVRGLTFGCANAPRDRLAAGYSIDPAGAPTPSELGPTNRSIYPSGGACGAARQLAAWGYQALTCAPANPHPILSCASIETMTTPRGEMGLGWFVHDIDGSRVISHPGADIGYASNLVVIPSRQLAFAVVANSTFASTGVVSQMLLADRLGKDFGFDRSAPDDAELRSWTGRYHNKSLGWARIERDGKGLWFVYENPEFNHEQVRTRLFPKPDWNGAGYYYAGTFRGAPMVLDGRITSDNPHVAVRTGAGDFARVDSGAALSGPAPAD